MTPVACALLFALCTWQVVTRGPILAADERLGHLIRGNAFPEALAEFLADAGGVLVGPVLLAALVAWQWFGARRRGGAPYGWTLPLTTGIALALVAPLVSLAKVLTGRPGPSATGGSGFFPSGHAATACVAFGACVLLLRGAAPSSRRWRYLVGACVVVNAAVGYGLVRRGYHWPLDVAASWALGGFLLWGAVAAARALLRWRSESDTE
ncbi:phosphatase PAP2 family protein [Streptomyces sp. BBFR102]|uniref:phosphatase PAP2 family protein n=1 Tax=Streptomyces sp. BBFR102 TaxID=3448171 RepID=UPI003F53BD86